MLIQIMAGYSSCTHISGFSVVFQIFNIPCQAKVGDFHNVIFPNKDVPGRKITMNTLHLEKHNIRQFAHLTLNFVVVASA